MKKYVLYRIKKKRNNLRTKKRRKGSWIGHTLHRNYLLKFVIKGNTEGRIEVTERRRTCQKLLDELNKTRE